jgi:NAD/NADP transhydrogenase alpha subunit
MAGHTLRFETKKGVGLVALIALQGTVLSFKAIPGLSVIERRLTIRPADQCGFTAGVFGMTAGTIRVALGAIDDARMVTTVVLHSSGYVAVTDRTLQLRPPRPECMTLNALKSPFEAAMRL